MNYPVWDLSFFGGGSLIAIIAVLHAYVAHLAVGGGIFLWWTDRLAVKTRDDNLLNYVKKHTRFFLLLTMVFGGLTGVGIWFIIGLVHPSSTSTLIHSFVFGWATEWVFFTVEITALLIYHYYFDRLSSQIRLKVAFIYALAAWISLAIINAILAFMLTPGKWIETGNFWQGIINPSCFSSLAFRSFSALMIAGLFGCITAVRIKDEVLQRKLIRYSVKWILYPAILIVLSGMWYLNTVPQEVRFRLFELNPESAIFYLTFVTASVIILSVALFLFVRLGKKVRIASTFVLVLVGLAWYGGFEYLREIARKPYVIQNFMYSNSIKKKEINKINKEGFLKYAKWAKSNYAELRHTEMGREILNLQCLPCHTLDGFKNDIVKRTGHLTSQGIQSFLTGMGKIHTYMPPFVGSEEEKKLLADYIYIDLQKGPKTGKTTPIKPKKAIKPEPPSEEYVLLAWNDLGMHGISDTSPWFLILPPANTLEAILIKRGAKPKLVTDVKITYEVESGFKNPSKHVKFWKYSEKYLGKKLENNTGLKGLGLAGEFTYDKELKSFSARLIPVLPYNDSGEFNPYPYFTIRAIDEKTGKVLAQTKTVAPTSTEMGCKNCHRGKWKFKGVAGMSDETAANILKIHDRDNNTNLYGKALNGNPVFCQSCHSDPALGMEGKKGILSLSAAMHGWHANYMSLKGDGVCQSCHAAKSDGRTQSIRGIHKERGIKCVDCHGNIDEHAASLLVNEKEKPSSKRLLKNLKFSKVKSSDEIKPRKPWLVEPDCLSCHTDFTRPTKGVSAYNKWVEAPELYRLRHGWTGKVRCIACHGSTHAIYPAVNSYEESRDNYQPLQYSGNPYPLGSNQTCEVCHKKGMEWEMHHTGILGNFGSK